MAAFIAYSVMCTVFGAILAILLATPLYNYLTRRDITRAITRILDEHEKSRA
jgi:flagellar motor component MotA